MGNLGFQEILLIAVVILVLFGGSVLELIDRVMHLSWKLFPIVEKVRVRTPNCSTSAHKITLLK